MSDLVPFVFPEGSREIRVVVVDGEPWFVGSDLARALEYSDATHALRSVRDRNKGLQIVETPGGQQECLCVNEPGLYQLIMKSRADAAERFQDWISDEVLPQIRKTGTYTPDLTPAELCLVQAQRLVEQERRQRALEAQQRELERQQIETRLGLLEQAQRLQLTEARLDSIEHIPDHLTILAWNRANGHVIHDGAAAAAGRHATYEYRRRFHAEPPQVRDQRYGTVNLYPVTLLDELFAS